MRCLRKIICLLLSVTLILSGCGRTAKKSRENQGVQEAETFRIVTSFYPLYIIMMNLTEDVPGIALINMASPQTGCLHDYQLRPKDLICLEDADLFVINGGGMEGFLADAMETYEDLEVACAMDAFSEEQLLPGGEEDEGENPHTWMNPRLYKEEVIYLAGILAKKDAAHKEQYETNAVAYEGRIDTLICGMEKERKGGQEQGCILLHESFAYLMDRLDIPVEQILDVEKDSGFSARELRELIDEVKEISNGIIVSDRQYSGQVARLLSEETGFSVVYLDSCVSGEYEKDAYLDSMKNNIREWENAEK